MDIGLDSVEIVVWAENEFAVEIADSVCSEILTLNQFVDCIHVLAYQKYGFDTPDKSEIYDRLIKLLIDKYDIPSESIFPDAEFIKDLGIQ